MKSARQIFSAAAATALVIGMTACGKQQSLNVVAPQEKFYFYDGRYFGLKYSTNNTAYLREVSKEEAKSAEALEPNSKLARQFDEALIDHAVRQQMDHAHGPARVSVKIDTGVAEYKGKYYVLKFSGSGDQNIESLREVTKEQAEIESIREVMGPHNQTIKLKVGPYTVGAEDGPDWGAQIDKLLASQKASQPEAPAP